jgi:multiple sugar transport system permease protein
MKNLGFGVRLPLHLLYILVGLLFVLPLWWSITSSLRPLDEIFKYTSPFSLEALFLDHLDFSAYLTIFGEREFGLAVLNSAFVAGMTVLGAPHC